MTPRIPPAVLGRIDELFQQHQGSGATPSSAWGVFDRSGLVHCSGAGRLDGGGTPGQDTAYRIASCTKSFTAAAVLALRDDGLLHLDEPVTRFIPAFSSVRLPTSDSPVPTVRMLLTMSAGFPTDDPWADRQEAMTAPELAAMISRGLSFESVPGTRFAYSNLGFALLGQVIERAAGRGYRELVLDRFLDPLGLTATAFDTTVAAPAVATGYRRSGEGWEPLPFSAPGAFSPIGGLFSTPADLARWAGWLTAAFDGDGRDTAGAPLSRASRRELQQLHRFAPDRSVHPCGYGFGLFVERYPTGWVTSHSGGYPGFSAHMRWSQDAGFGIVAFANATGARVSAPTTAAFDLLAELAHPEPARVAWEHTLAIRDAVTGLIGNWSDEVARTLFSENVALDSSFAQRRTAIASAIDRIGGLTGGTGNPDAQGGTASHPVWKLPGRNGDLRVEVLLTPEFPPRVQSLTVTEDLPES